MGVSVEWFWSLAVSVIGFLIGLVLLDIKTNLKDIWAAIQRLREETNECNGRHDLAEERAKYLAERLASVEAKTRQ